MWSTNVPQEFNEVISKTWVSSHTWVRKTIGFCPVVVVVLHTCMPGLARWITPGRSSCRMSCGSIKCTIYLFSSASSYFFVCLFLCFFFLLLGVDCLFGRRGWLPFLAGEVDCLFGRICSAWWRYCVHVHGRVAVAEIFLGVFLYGAFIYCFHYPCPWYNMLWIPRTLTCIVDVTP